MWKELLIEMSQNPKIVTAIGFVSGSAAKIAEWGGMIGSAWSALLIFLGAAAPTSVLILNIITAKQREREHGAQIRLQEKNIELKDLEIQLLRQKMNPPGSSRDA